MDIEVVHMTLTTSECHDLEGEILENKSQNRSAHRAIN